MALDFAIQLPLLCVISFCPEFDLKRFMSLFSMKSSLKSSLPSDAVETKYAPSGNPPAITENPMGAYRDPIADKGDRVSEPSSSDSESDDDALPVSRPCQQRRRLEWEQPLDIEPGYVPVLPKPPPEGVNLCKLGNVSALIDGVVIIKSLPGAPALDKESSVFFNDRRPLGEIYDTFGSISLPMYAVVHENRKAQQTKKSPEVADQPTPQSGPSKVNVEVEVGDEVFYADAEGLRKKVPIQKLVNIKATDATGKNDVELSDDEDDSTEDEQERIVRPRKRKSTTGGKTQDSSKQSRPPQSRSTYNQPKYGQSPGYSASSYQYQQYNLQQQQSYPSPIQFIPSGEMLPQQAMMHAGLAPDSICLTKPPPQYMCDPMSQMMLMAQQQQQQQQLENPEHYPGYYPSSSYNPYPGQQWN